MEKARHATSASLQEAKFSGFECRLRSIAHTQLAQDVAEVVLDRAAGDRERLADLVMGSSTCQQSQDLPLPLGQLEHITPVAACKGCRSGLGGLNRCGGEGGKDFTGNLWMQENLPLCNRANGCEPGCSAVISLST